VYNEHSYRTARGLLIALAITAAFVYSVSGAALSPKLRQLLPTLADSQPAGVVIVSFNTQSGLTNAHLNVLRAVGITEGVTFEKMGMVGAVMTAGQVRALQNDPSIRSLWSNDKLRYHMNQARVMTGVDKIRTDTNFTFRNGGMPVTGNGDFSVFVIDSGIDATHADLMYGTKVIQNTHRVVSTTTGDTGITVAGVPLNGFTPSLSIENLPNTDNVGHGTHCAGIVGGTGARSGGNYAGVATGAKIVGSGGGAGIVVLNALAGWEWGFANRDLYRIRVITNSYGPIGGEEYDPEHPFVIASQLAHSLNVTVLFSGGNDGAQDTYSPYGQSPWAMGIAAGTKDGMLATFSSRGTPREQRLSDSNPLNDNDAPTLTAPGSGRYFDSSYTRWGFTTDIISVRSSINASANGTWFPAPGADAELPAGMIPFYTQISGTSMATPFVAGVVALMLDVDPTLTPDEIRSILVSTTTKMPGYADHEVGAGYLNAYAALDKVYNRTKGYNNFSEVSFNAQFGEERPPVQSFYIEYDPSVSGPGSANSREFTVNADMNVLDVFARVDAAAGAGTGNFVGLRIYDPNGRAYGASSIPTPVVGTDVRQVIVPNPIPGRWRMEIRGACGLAAVPGVCSPQQLASPGPVDATVTQVKYILPNITDIAGHPQQAQIEAALKRRVIDIYTDGTFRPEQTVSREDLARSLVLNAPVRQSIQTPAKFTDVSGDLARIADAVTAKGPTIRDYNFVPTGLMSHTGNLFKPADPVNRLDLAVALVKAIGRDNEARALAGSTVTYQGTPLSDNAQIPAALRGYVQIAINNGMFETWPAQVIQIGPGQWQALPGPRFEPATLVKRAALAAKLTAFQDLFNAGG
jgi:serine protease AprX